MCFGERERLAFTPTFYISDLGQFVDSCSRPGGHRRLDILLATTTCVKPFVEMLLSLMILVTIVHNINISNQIVVYLLLSF
jgi:hypothetical protein